MAAAFTTAADAGDETLTNSKFNTKVTSKSNTPGRQNEVRHIGTTDPQRYTIVGKAQICRLLSSFSSKNCSNGLEGFKWLSELVESVLLPRVSHR